MKLFPGYKYYPIVEVEGKKALDTEYGLIEIGDYELRCHECKQQLAYKIEVEEKPRMASIYRNFWRPYFLYMNGDCFHGIHGGFGRPAWIREKKIRQSKLEDWL